jgi:hypothetical protein
MRKVMYNLELTNNSERLTFHASDEEEQTVEE